MLSSPSTMSLQQHARNPSLQRPQIITPTISQSPQSSRTLKDHKHGANSSTTMLSPTGQSSSSVSPSSLSPSSGGSPLSAEPQTPMTASMPIPIANPNTRTAIESPSVVKGNPMENGPSHDTGSSQSATHHSTVRRTQATTPSEALSRAAFSPNAESYMSSGTYFSSETGNSEWSYASSELLTPPLFQGDTDNPPFKAEDQDATSFKMNAKAGRSSTTQNGEEDVEHCRTRHHRKRKKRLRESHKRSHAPICQVAPTAPTGHKHLCKGHVGRYRPRRFDRGNTDTYGRMLPRLPSDPPPPLISRRWSSVESGTHQQRLKALSKRPTLPANPTVFRDRKAFPYATHRRYRSSTFTLGDNHHDIVRSIRKKLTLRKVPPSCLSVPTTITLRRASENSNEAESSVTTDKPPMNDQEVDRDTQDEPDSTMGGPKRRDTLFMITRKEIDSIAEFLEEKMRRIHLPRGRRTAPAERPARSGSSKEAVSDPTTIAMSNSPPTITTEAQRDSISTVSEADSVTSSMRPPKITNKGIMPHISFPTVVVSEALSAFKKPQSDPDFLQVISSTRSWRRGATRSLGSNRSTEIIWEAGTPSPGTEDDSIGSPLSNVSTQQQSRDPTPRTPSQIVLSDFFQAAHSGRGRRMTVSKSPSDKSSQMDSGISSQQQSRERTLRSVSRIVLSDFLHVAHARHGRRNAVSRSPSDKSTDMASDVSSQEQSREQTPRAASHTALSGCLQDANNSRGRSHVGSKSPSNKSAKISSEAEPPSPVSEHRYLAEKTSDGPSQQRSRNLTPHNRSDTKDSISQSSTEGKAFDPNDATESIKDWSWKLPQVELPAITVQSDSDSSSLSLNDAIPTEKLSTSKLQADPDRPQIKTSISDSNLSKSSSVRRQLRSVRSASNTSELLDVISFPPLPKRRTSDWISPLPDIESSGPNSVSTFKSETKSSEKSAESLHDIGIDATGITIVRPIKMNASLTSLINEDPPSPDIIFPLDYQLRRRSTVKFHPKAPARVGLFATLGSSLGSSSGERRKSSIRSPQTSRTQFLDNKYRPSASRTSTWHKARPDTRLPSAAGPFQQSSPAEDSQDPLASNRDMRSGRINRMQLIEDGSPPIPKPDHVGIYERITGARWGRKREEEVDMRQPVAADVHTRQPSVDWIG